MPRMTTKQFKDEKRSSGGGNFFNIKKEGKTIGWIHPLLGFYERFRHATLAWNADDEKGTLKYRGFNCAGEVCALCVLKEWAKKMLSSDSSIADDIVLSASKGKGKDDIDLSMSDLAGEGDWKSKITDIKKEFAICWIPHEDIESDSPYKILDMVPGLFFSIQEIIKSRISDEGEDDGNPLSTPWAMKLVYNKDATTASDYYKAQAASERSFPYNEIVEELLSVEPSKDDIDLDKLTEESYYGEQLEALSLAWYKDAPFEFDDFVEFFESNTNEDAREAADEKKDSKKSEKKDTKKSSKSKNAKRSSKNATRKGTKSTKSIKNTKSKAEKTCRECGEEIGDAKFCGSCGTSVKGLNVESNKEEVCCDDCGKMVIPTKRGRCPECGLTLDVPY